MADEGAKAYRIIKWREKHSNAEAARRDRLDWIKCPARFDSLGLKTLLTTPGGIEAFGIYVLLAEAAAMAPKEIRDGSIVNEDQGALSAKQISLKIGVPTARITKALKMLMSPEVGWIESIPWSIQAHSCVDSESTAVDSKSTSLAGASDSPSLSVSVSPSGSGPASTRDARQEAFRAMQRALGRRTTSSDDAHLDRYVDGLNGSSVVVHGEQVEHWALVHRAIVEAAKHGDCQTAKGLVRYVGQIVERCMQHECWPGEFPSGDGGQRKAMSDDEMRAKGLI